MLLDSSLKVLEEFSVPVQRLPQPDKVFCGILPWFVYLCESKISVLVTMEKKVTIDYRRCYVLLCQRLYHNFIPISQISLRFTTEQLEFFKLIFFRKPPFFNEK